VLVAPWYHPLRLAGELAMLSNLTDRRIYVGLGRGTAMYEYEAYGLEMGDARERFRETWEVLDRALAGDPFTYEGVHHRVTKPVRVRPTPKRDRLEFFGAIGSASSTEVMAGLGLAPMCTSFGTLTPELLPAWEAAADAAGTRERVSPLRPLLVNTIVADTDELAIADAKVYMTRYMQAQIDHYDPHNVDIAHVPGYESWASTFARWQGLTDPENIVAWTEGQLIGSPDTVARKVQAFVDAGFNHIILHSATPGTPRDVQFRWTERFARDVAPRFNSAFSAVRAR
jgi:alkanesulfonate monooxygenase SsuD/methylene tetrahydromethanopterin reductase-like flavin-dependent oxidoreductase (luciferase family)